MTDFVQLREYGELVSGLKARIEAARVAAARSINRELLGLYWDIGAAIVETQRAQSWGDSVVESLSADLRSAFPGATGFSARNLRSMRQFHETYTAPAFWRQVAAKMNKTPEISVLHGGDLPDVEIRLQPAAEILRQVVAEVPWGHHLVIMARVSDPTALLYYVTATARFGWSRNVLLNQIKAGAYERSLAEGKSHNFDATLPVHLAEQAEEALKSSYNLEFLGIAREVRERELEDRLIGRLQEFLIELGYGFSFLGRQYRLRLGEKEYFIDLLFYHRFLRALVAVELKVGPFTPEHAGKMDFYLNLLNETERAPDDNPSIGIILCAEKDSLEVEFALKSKANPIGVAEYQLQRTLPEELAGKLPTSEQLDRLLSRELRAGEEDE